MSQKRAVVHLLLEHFREACRGRGFEDLVALNEGLDAILSRYGSGWRKPSAGEAVLAGEPPWFRSGKVGSPLDWGASLRDSISLGATGLSSAEQLDLFGSRAAREVRVALGRGEAPDLRN